MPPILKCDKDDEERELDFELDYQLSLTAEERFRMMFQKSKELKEMKKAAGRARDKEDMKILMKIKQRGPPAK